MHMITMILFIIMTDETEESSSVTSAQCNIGTE